MYEQKQAQVQTLKKGAFILSRKSELELADANVPDEVMKWFASIESESKKKKTIKPAKVIKSDSLNNFDYWYFRNLKPNHEKIKQLIGTDISLILEKSAPWVLAEQNMEELKSCDGREKKKK